MGLSAKQERFVREYLIDCNGTQAAIRAGYSAKTAPEQAARLLINVKVSERIAELKAAIDTKLDLEATWVLAKYKAIADFRIEDVMDFDGVEATFKPMEEWPASAKVAISNLRQTTTEHGKTKVTKIEFRIEDRLRALEALGRHLGMFSDFDMAIRTLRTYGVSLIQDESDAWKVE